MGPLVLDFWFDFASTYSYPSAMRIGVLAARSGVRVNFRPFLLGPIFKAQGWTTSPFNLYPGKGRHMWRDLERICADLGLPFRRPDPFPQNSLLAARVALAWVQAQPGVTSTIIGARRLAHLEDNLKALEVKLSAEEFDRLDALTKPMFSFPQSMQPWFAAVQNGGTSVNGVSAPPSASRVEKGDKIY